MATLRTTNLGRYLVPDSQTRVPSVTDENGVTVSSNDRITNDKTVVNIGDSPNSNTGDPLRVAFVKINNFIEASYQVNKAIDSELNLRVSVSNVIDGGAF